ncbi:MAG: hypothetical protein GXO47_10825 [Chlorobi bacterium]|nr:hypothetical protein [Chlorobiota bacterium]
MKKILLILQIFVLVFFVFGFTEQDPLESELCSEETPVVETTNENVLVKTFIYTNWRDISTIWDDTYDDLRNSMITELNNRINEDVSTLQDMTDEDLAYSAIMYKFLLDAGIRSESELLSLTLSDLRNTIISENSNHTSYSVETLQGYSNKKNLNIAYSWWFTDNAETNNMIEELNAVTKNLYFFDRKDDRGVSTDVLKVLKVDEDDYTYLGVYHSMVDDNHFQLYLAGSNDLATWTFITELGDRAHQGDLKKWEGGYLLANEQDTVEGSNNIQVRYYASYDDLKNNIPANTVSLNRVFSPSAEGTPDIKIISGNSPTSSNILIGFHYYDNNVVDQLAFGILNNFCCWKAWKDEVSNYNLIEMGYQGNLGSRSSFVYNGNSYVLQEAQIEPNDWSKWRMMFGNGAYYYQLDPETPKGSTSFANPGIEQIGADIFTVTSFLPSEGNQTGEIGEMIYNVDFSK